MMKKILLGVAVFILASILCLSFGQDVKYIEESQPLEGVKRIEVRLSFSAGRVELAAGDAEKAYEAELEYSRTYFYHQLDYHKRGGTGVLDLRVKGKKRSLFRSRWKKNWLSLKLNPTVPIDLDLNIGACESTVDLTGLKISNLELSTGASEMDVYFDKANEVAMKRMQVEAGVGELKVVNLGNANCRKISFQGGIGDYDLDFSGEWQGDCEAEIELGIGDLTVKLPRSIGVKLIAQKSFLTSLDIDDFIKEDDIYYSEGYRKAKYHLILRVEAGLGSINIRWID